MRSVLFSLRLAGLALVAMVPAACTHVRHVDEKALAKAQGDGSNGTYYAAPNKLFDRDLAFDVRWNVVHEPITKTMDPTLNVDNRQLAFNRCTQCHDGGCGFNEAFDYDNYGKPNWKPRIRGQQWAQPAVRMIPKPNSFLNDVIVERIYSFLRDETTIGYDFSKDKKGAVTVETDEQGNPIKHERATTPQK